MKTEQFVKTEIEIDTIIIDIKCRYVGDGEDDDVPTNTPMLTGDTWLAVVEIDTGKIKHWPKGKSVNLYSKVCDAGVYTLCSPDGSPVAAIAGYVPHGVVPGDWGDYVDLKIDENGVITNWPENTDVSDFFSTEE